MCFYIKQKYRENKTYKKSCWTHDENYEDDLGVTSNKEAMDQLDFFGGKMIDEADLDNW